MNLQGLCMQNMVEMIKKLPPMMKEEIIGSSLTAIKEESLKKARLEVIKEISRSSIIVDDVTDRMIIAHRTSQNWSRPEYTKDIDDELYQIFVDISERFVNKNSEKLIFNQNHEHIPLYVLEEIHSDDDEYDDDDFLHNSHHHHIHSDDDGYYAEYW